jgi:hypothetical protein
MILFFFFEYQMEGTYSSTLCVHGVPIGKAKPKKTKLKETKERAIH